MCWSLAQWALPEQESDLSKQSVLASNHCWKGWCKISHLKPQCSVLASCHQGCLDPGHQPSGQQVSSVLERNVCPELYSGSDSSKSQIYPGLILGLWAMQAISESWKRHLSGSSLHHDAICSGTLKPQFPAWSRLEQSPKSFLKQV